MPDYRRRRRRRAARRYARFAKRRARRFRRTPISTGRYLPLTLKNDEPLILKKPSNVAEFTAPFVETHFRFNCDLDAVKRQLEPYRNLWREIKIKGVTITFNPTWNRRTILQGIKYQTFGELKEEPALINNIGYGAYRTWGKLFPPMYRAVFEGNWESAINPKTDTAYTFPADFIPCIFANPDRTKKNLEEIKTLLEQVAKEFKEPVSRSRR